MTADMPDAAIVAREALAKKYDETGWHDQAAYIRDAGHLDTDPLKFAILGTRAMQDALAGRVRVKALEWVEPPLSETMRKCETPLGTYRTWTHHEADGQWFWSFEFGMMTEQGKGASEAEVQAAAQAHRSSLILSALEPAGAQEGAEGPALNLHDAYAREKAAKDVRTEPTPTPAPDVPDLVPVTITNAKTGETRQAYVDRSRGVVLERDATAAEAERDALKAEVEDKHAQITELEHCRRADTAVIAGLNKQLTEEIAATSAIAKKLLEAGTEITALKAEVEKKDKALAVVREQAARTDEIALALLAQINPHVDLADGPSQLFFSLHDQIKVHGPAARRAALSPAKAGG